MIYRTCTQEVEIDIEECFPHIQKYYSPEDIFDVEELKRWAEDNGYIEEDK